MVFCCSQGTKPDLQPKKNPDGSCATHVVKKDEVCYDILAIHLLEQGDIQNFVEAWNHNRLCCKSCLSWDWNQMP